MAKPGKHVLLPVRVNGCGLSLDMTCSTPELRAQFQPYQTTKREVTTPEKHVLLPVHVKMAASSQPLNYVHNFNLTKQPKEK